MKLTEKFNIVLCLSFFFRTTAYRRISIFTTHHPRQRKQWNRKKPAVRGIKNRRRMASMRTEKYTSTNKNIRVRALLHALHHRNPISTVICFAQLKNCAQVRWLRLDSNFAGTTNNTTTQDARLPAAKSTSRVQMIATRLSPTHAFFHVLVLICHLSSCPSSSVGQERVGDNFGSEAGYPRARAERAWAGTGGRASAATD